MRTTIYQKDFNEILMEAEYPDWFKDDSEPLFERTFSASLFFGKGVYKEIYFEGVHIGYGNLELAKNTLFHFETEFETVEMHFSLNGITSTDASELSGTVDFVSGEHNIFYSKGTTGISKWSSKLPLRIFEINLSPTFFEKYIPSGSKRFLDFKKAITDRRSAILSSTYNFPITLEMGQLINEIIQCQRKGLFKRIFLESKIIALLLTQLEQMYSYDVKNAPVNLKKKDIEKIYAVKEILEKDYKKTTTLVNLAKEVGTNEFTLKRGFKELFGTSVYHYWKCLRLETAKTMLIEHQMTIKEVANEIGYKNPQHFTAAFKKEFGTLPSSIRN